MRVLLSQPRTRAFGEAAPLPPHRTPLTRTPVPPRWPVPFVWLRLRPQRGLAPIQTLWCAAHDRADVWNVDADQGSKRSCSILDLGMDGTTWVFARGVPSVARAPGPLTGG